MKNLRTIALCVSISLYSLCSYAQPGDVPLHEHNLNKPKLFQHLPDVIPVKMSSVTSLFGAEIGRPVSISLSDAASFQFEGNVVCSVSQYENTFLSVVVRSTNFPGARFVISKNTDATGTISYTGMIVSMQHGDMYQLKNENNQFVFVKKGIYSAVDE